MLNSSSFRTNDSSKRVTHYRFHNLPPMVEISSECQRILYTWTKCMCPGGFYLGGIEENSVGITCQTNCEMFTQSLRGFQVLRCLRKCCYESILLYATKALFSGFMRSRGCLMRDSCLYFHLEKK